MKENFEHYISRSIRSFYQHRIVSPIIYLVILAVIAFFYPVNGMMHPVVADENEDIASLYDKNGRYIEITLSNLYFTGYTKRWLDTTVGYYYYTIMEDDCIIVLLNPDDSQQGLPVIDQITIRGKILYNSHAMNKLLLYLSEDLAWSQDGIASTISPYMISQPDITDFASVVFLSVYVISGLLSVLCVMAFILPFLYYLHLSEDYAVMGNQEKFWHRPRKSLLLFHSWQPKICSLPNTIL